MNFTLSAIDPVISIVFGVLILIFPESLNYLIAIYLIFIGLIGLGILNV